MEEIWKDILNFEGYYQASNLGNIKSLGNGKTYKSARLLKPGHTGKDKAYRFVVLCKNGIKEHKRVCRLVYEAFNGQIPEGMQVNHINENTCDDQIENLNLMTAKENINWGTRTERARISNTNHPNKSKWVVQLSLKDEILHFYPSVSQAQRETGFSRSSINRCCLGIQESANNFKWKYAS